MNLVASLIVAEAERDRYLLPCVESLLTFCDEVVLLFDGDGRWAAELAGAWGADGSRVIPITPALHDAPVAFFAHEGRARNRLLDATLARNPTHVLAIDADEFVADGPLLRQTLETDRRSQVWPLCMLEVWQADRSGFRVRLDGGWVPHPIPCCYAVPPPNRRGLQWRIADRPLACGREPQAVRQLYRRAGAPVTEILHFGWANEAERQTRYERYRVADGGRFHASAHLQSILWREPRVQLCDCPWPAGLAAVAGRVAARANAVPTAPQAAGTRRKPSG